MDVISLLLQVTLVLGPTANPIFSGGFECRGTRPWSGTVGQTPTIAPAGQPALQCQWPGPPPGDLFPDHVQVLGMPMVADLPYASSAGTEIVFVSYNFIDGGADAGRGDNPLHFGVLRVIDGCNCTQIATVADPSHPLIATASPALGDIDGDGTIEIVALRAGGGLVTFAWDAQLQDYATWWAAGPGDTELETKLRWDGPALHDLDDDGIAEVIAAHEVFDGVTGTRLNPTDIFAQPTVIPTYAVDDLEQDGIVDLVSDVIYFWDTSTETWLVRADGPFGQGHSAVADFGTATLGNFDPALRDGVAEIVTSTTSATTLRDLFGATLLSVPASASRSAPAIADFDGDGRPEIAVADGNSLRVLDLDCQNAGAGCVGGFVRWSSPIQEPSSSGSTCTSIDLMADGTAEVVYADECYGRLYDGLTGDVISAWPRRSCTFGEGLSIADTDSDGSAELVVPSNSNCNISCPALDPLHSGLRCQADAECLSGVCDSGLCRCSAAAECPALTACAAPLTGTPGTGLVCRASTDATVYSGVRVLGDPSEGWTTATPIWNQHGFSTTNVESDGRIPRTSTWPASHATNGPNTYRDGGPPPP
jgi:hypothetical protein